jgi:hypothetical protein
MEPISREEIIKKDGTMPAPPSVPPMTAAYVAFIFIVIAILGALVALYPF